MNFEGLAAAFASESEKLRGEAGQSKAMQMRADILGDISRVLVNCGFPPLVPSPFPLSDSPPTHTPATPPSADPEQQASAAPPVIPHMREKLSLTRKPPQPKLFGPSASSTPLIDSIIDKWNSNFSLPRIYSKTEKLVSSIMKSTHDNFWRDNWRDGFSKLTKSDFLMNKKRGGRPDIYWFLDIDNLSSLVNGKFDDSKSTEQKAKDYERKII